MEAAVEGFVVVVVVSSERLFSVDVAGWHSAVFR